MATQIKQRQVNVTTMMSKRAFLTGVDDARSGIAPRRDIIDNGGYTSGLPDAELYERGRAFGICAPRDWAVKIGRKIKGIIYLTTWIIQGIYLLVAAELAV